MGCIFAKTHTIYLAITRREIITDFAKWKHQMYLTKEKMTVKELPKLFLLKRKFLFFKYAR